MATGLHPDHHGIINNYFYAADLGLEYNMKNPADVTNPGLYGGEPIWNTAEKQGLRSAIYYWVGSEAPIQSRHPSLYRTYDPSVSFTERANQVIEWLSLPEAVRPHLVMWYYEEPDTEGHLFLPESHLLSEKVEELDSMLNYFFSRARTLDIFDRTDFIVLSDHGMAAFTPEKYINLIDYLPRDSFEYVFDGVPTILYPHPGYTETAYSILKTIPYIEVYRKSEIPDKYLYGQNFRIGELIVLPDVGGYVHFREGVGSRPGAAHGYDNFSQEMEAIFYAAGPSFVKNKHFEAIPNINLYLIICHILRLTPAPNDGCREEIDMLFNHLTP